MTNVTTNNTGTLTIVDVAANDTTDGCKMYRLLQSIVSPNVNKRIPKLSKDNKYSLKLCNDAIRGYAHCVFLLCSSPIEQHAKATENTLTFSTHARAIDNTVLRLPKTPRLSLASPYFVRRKKFTPGNNNNKKPLY